MELMLIHTDNRSVIETLLKQVAGKAVISTITTFEDLEKALVCVTRDMEKRFPVPANVDFSVRYVHAGGHCLTSELTFRRSEEQWHLESVRRRNPLPDRGPWIKYILDPWAFAVFKIHARDGRSMRSVERVAGDLTAHQKIALTKLAASLPPRRRKKLACVV
jgi:hypothetical protein